MILRGLSTRWWVPSSSWRGFLCSNDTLLHLHGSTTPTPMITRNSSNKSKNPYMILGVPPTSSLETVQKAFVKLALRYHPDTASSETTAEFVEIRQAFERVRRAKNGSTRNSSSSSSSSSSSYEDYSEEEAATDASRTAWTRQWTEQDFLQYFHRQTGVLLTSDQRRELVDLYRTRAAKNGYYGGHSWDLARRLVAEQDAFLTHTEKGGSFGCAKNKKGTQGRANKASFQGDAEEKPAPVGANFRRTRRR